MENKIIDYFKKLCSIPHASKNEKGVADFLVDFAKEHNLFFYRDNFNNVLIKKENKNRKPIILQAHTDMVCVKEPDFNFNFDKEPIKVIEENNFISAYKTSLGADNGIGVAIILTFLSEDNDYNIEALFTTDEEVTMTGALNFDYSLLNSDRLISLDGFSSDELINGCASICDMKMNFSPCFIEEKLDGFELEVSGLRGGHSGTEISSNLGNANNILAEILSNFKNLKLSSFCGGNQFNFITNFAKASFYAQDFETKFEEIKRNYKDKYKDININYKKVIIPKYLNEEFSGNLINLLNYLETGVLLKDKNNIIMSQNLACVNLDKGLIKISERSHNEDVENEHIEFLKKKAKDNKFSFEIFDRQKGFVSKKNSALTKELSENYLKLNNKPIKIITKHFSLEASIFKQMLPNLDIAVVSADIYDVHSTKERVFIPSIFNTYKLINNFLLDQ